jgi:hypothetical protein
MFQYEKSEGVIRSRKLQKDGQYNGKNKKKDKRANNDLQNIKYYLII